MKNLMLLFAFAVSTYHLHSQDISKINQMLEFVKVDGGTFTMGSSEFSDAVPHQVEINSFYIQKTELTQELWVAVMVSNPSKNKCENCPVESVRWTDVKAFIEKLDSISGKKYRLPTEAEWEYAARGGKISKGFKHAGSDDADEVAWHYDNSKIIIRPVAQKKPNELGLYDMSGNVAEWCHDWYAKITTADSAKNPIGASEGKDRVTRGGSYNDYAKDSHVAYRNYWSPGLWGRNLGFRLVYSAE